MPATSNWSAKNARRPEGGLLNSEEVLQGVMNSTQDALRVEALPPTSATTGTAAAIAAVDAAPDKSVGFTWEAAVLGGNRVESIVTSSASLGLSYTQTFTYVSGTDDVENIVTSS